MAQSTVCKVMAKSDDADTCGHQAAAGRSLADHR